MSLSQAGTLSSLAPFALNWPGLAGYARNSSADQTASSLNSASKRQPLSSSFGNDSAQVSLSDAARALAAFENGGSGSDASSGSNNSSSSNPAPGSPDFSNEALYLGGVADASLVAMGIITPDQQAGTQITFDSLSYNVSSSTSAGISQQNGQTVAAYSSEQQAEFVGQGHITTSDGRTFDFQVEVDLDQSQQVEAVGGEGLGSTQSSGDNAALAASATPPSLPPLSSNSSSGIASPSAATAGSINWDEILKQSKSLIDLLEAIGTANQAAQSTQSDKGKSADANATAAKQAGTTQGSGTSSGNTQDPATSPTQQAQAA
ncbi:MAG: hypothetical protein JO002_15225 [Burkholderiaceae bacterium]|nr:hypothetical protein [Burkholderiaceae bacterium]